VTELEIRNLHLVEFLKNPYTLPKSLWPRAFAVAFGAGLDLPFDILRNMGTFGHLPFNALERQSRKRKGEQLEEEELQAGLRRSLMPDTSSPDVTKRTSPMTAEALVC